MNKRELPLVVCLSLIASSTLIPAYAEVTSLKTNAAFYKGGSKIYFSGTIQNNDPSGVTLLVFNPNNDFTLLSSGIADANHTFQIMVDTSISDNQQKFSLKGIYNATAFIANKTSGKTVSFVFSPDGSPIVPSLPIGLTASPRSSTEIDLSWSAPSNNGGSSISGYKIERNDGNGFIVVQNTETTTYQDTGLAPSKQYSYRVSAINSAGASNPSNVVYATTLSAQTQTTQSTTQSNTPTSGTNNDQSIDKIIQQRIEAAKKLKELLDQQNGRYLSAVLYENIGVGDSIGKPNIENSAMTSLFTSSGEYDFKNVLYPLIALGGVGIVVAILYAKKRIPLRSDNLSTIKQIESPSIPSSDASEDDYALMILRNRLAKSEITVEEYRSIKDALDEP